MTAINYYKYKNKIKLPILNFQSNKLLNYKSYDEKKQNNNKDELKLKFKFNNDLLSNISILDNSIIKNKKSANNKISSIPITISKNKSIQTKFSYNRNKSNRLDNNIINTNNKNNNIVNILKNIKNINNKLRENNSIESDKIYQIIDKKRKSSFEKYFQYNSCFNNMYYKIKNNKKAKFKKNNYSLREKNSSNDSIKMNKTILNLNKTQTTFLIRILKFENKINPKNTLIIDENKYKKMFGLNNSNKFLSYILKKKTKLKTNNKKNSFYFSYSNNDSFLREDKEKLIKSNGRFNISSQKLRRKNSETIYG